MDEAAVGKVWSDLVDWGIIEPAPSLQPTRRFRGAIMRAAAMLREEETAGKKREGNAIENAIGVALAAYPLPPGAVAGPDHARLLVAIELASMPPAVRSAMGL